MSQQPVDVYPSPNTIPTQASSHSKGSFAPVLIVLAVILVVTLIAVVLGRICSKRSHGTRAEKHHNHRGKKNGKSAKKGDRFQPSEGDIEYGFDKRIPTSKVADGNGRGPRLPPLQPEPKAQVRFSDDHIEFRTGP